VKLSEKFLGNIRKGLAELGYFEGQNYRFEFRDAYDRYDLIPALSRELADQKVTLIIATTTLQVAAAKAATQSIPIVFTIGTDPVENGFVASLNKPGGNITGIYNLALTLTGKRVEVLRELLPSVIKFAFLTDSGNLTLTQLQMRHVKAAADSLGLSILNVTAHTQDELEAAFETAVRAGAGGMIVGADAVFFPLSPQLVALAARYRLPTIYVNDTAVKVGGLICYGADQNAPDLLVAKYAGRILKGEKPADMPVQLATTTRFLINLTTAKDLGITVPISLLGRADEVIE
jgi:putative tryptophan/tyrosine transport system substrate-binding protein